MGFHPGIGGGSMAAGAGPKAKCPICKRWVWVAGGHLVNHGPGAKTFTCPGSGTNWPDYLLISRYQKRSAK